MKKVKRLLMTLILMILIINTGKVYAETSYSEGFDAGTASGSSGCNTGICAGTVFGYYGFRLSFVDKKGKEVGESIYLVNKGSSKLGATNSHGKLSELGGEKDEFHFYLKGKTIGDNPFNTSGCNKKSDLNFCFENYLTDDNLKKGEYDRLVKKLSALSGNSKYEKDVENYPYIKLQPVVAIHYNYYNLSYTFFGSIDDVVRMMGKNSKPGVIGDSSAAKFAKGFTKKSSCGVQNNINGCWNVLKNYYTYVNVDTKKVKIGLSKSNKSSAYDFYNNEVSKKEKTKFGKAYIIRENFEQKDAYINIFKYVKGTSPKKAIKGAKFAFYSDTSCKKNKYQATYTTDKNGKIKITKLKNGKKLKDGKVYCIKETFVPTPYIITNKGAIKVKATETSKEVKIANEKDNSVMLKIIKVKKGDWSKGLSGAKFKITRNKTGNTWNCTTGEDGSCTKKLKLNAKYTIEETQAPPGYKISGTKKTVKLKNTYNQVVFENEEIPDCNCKSDINKYKGNKKELEKIYYKYSEGKCSAPGVGGNYTNILNFNNPSCSTATLTPPQVDCLSISSIERKTDNLANDVYTIFNENDLSKFTKKVSVDGKTAYCRVDYRFSPVFDISELKPVYSGQLYFNIKDKDGKILKGDFVENCYFIGENNVEGSFQDIIGSSEVDNYISNLSLESVPDETRSKFLVSNPNDEDDYEKDNDDYNEEGVIEAEDSESISEDEDINEIDLSEEEDDGDGVDEIEKEETNSTVVGGITKITSEKNNIYYYFDDPVLVNFNGSIVSSEDCNTTNCRNLGYGIASKFYSKTFSGIKDDIFNFKVNLTYGISGGMEETKDMLGKCVFKYKPQAIIETPQVEFRIIDTKNPFVNKTGETRNTMTNWCYDENRTKSATSVKDATTIQKYIEGKSKIDGLENYDYYKDGVINLVDSLVAQYTVAKKGKTSSCSADNDLVKTVISDSTNSYNRTSSGKGTGAKYKITLTPQLMKDIVNEAKNLEITYDEFNLDCDDKEIKTCTSKLLTNLKDRNLLTINSSSKR